MGNHSVTEGISHTTWWLNHTFLMAKSFIPFFSGRNFNTTLFGPRVLSCLVCLMVWKFHMFDPSRWCLNGGFSKWKIPKSPWLSVAKWFFKHGWRLGGILNLSQFRTPPNDHPWWFENFEGHVFFRLISSAVQPQKGHGWCGVFELLHPGAADALRWLSAEWPNPGVTTFRVTSHVGRKHQAIVALSNLLGYSNYVYLKLSKVI